MAANNALELEPVSQVAARLNALLERARALKTLLVVEPPLPTADLEEDVGAVDQDLGGRYDQTLKYNTIETAAREIFYNLTNAADITDPAFAEVWNLLDILLLCGDRGKCTPELVCYLLEEILDSQTTSGCRTIFDYLESRRERLVQRDFHKKNLVFLRSCNELLRRLSRAEDAIFCGRVFFFLFQTFPLGDKSSVNLRGAFHTENTTAFEELPPKAEDRDVEIEDRETPNVDAPAKEETPKPQSQATHPTSTQAIPASKAKETLLRTTEEDILDTSTLYPVFWRLQQNFSDPTRLFTPENFTAFKTGLESTLAKFRKTRVVVQTKAGSQRSTKSRLGSDGGEVEDHLAENRNPKYLTSHDLFDLELGDLAFQRHIMVQALILIDFLLSLTEKAKKKLAALQSTNKSMLYNFTLSEDDSRWVNATRSKITNYLQQGPDGKFYHRMVETVLTRDKNWVRWKIESCPSIVRDPVTTTQELEARQGARDAVRQRRLPEKPMGAMNLSFLSECGSRGLQTLKDPKRFIAPSSNELIRAVQGIELDLEMANTDDERAQLETAITNKTWRALRQARMSCLGVLDRVEPGMKLEDVFRKDDVAGVEVGGDRAAMISRDGDEEVKAEGGATHGTGSGALDDKLVENGVTG